MPRINGKDFARTIGLAKNLKGAEKAALYRDGGQLAVLVPAEYGAEATYFCRIADGTLEGAYEIAYEDLMKIVKLLPGNRAKALELSEGCGKLRFRILAARKGEPEEAEAEGELGCRPAKRRAVPDAIAESADFSFDSLIAVSRLAAEKNEFFEDLDYACAESRGGRILVDVPMLCGMARISAEAACAGGPMEKPFRKAGLAAFAKASARCLDGTAKAVLTADGIAFRSESMKFAIPWAGGGTRDYWRLENVSETARIPYAEYLRAKAEAEEGARLVEDGGRLSFAKREGASCAWDAAKIEGIAKWFEAPELSAAEASYRGGGAEGAPPKVLLIREGDAEASLLPAVAPSRD